MKTLQMRFLRKVWPLKVWLLFVVPFFIPVTASLSRLEKPCSSKVDVSIGHYSSLAAGQRAAFQRLAYEIKRCPQAQLYTIRRNGGGIKYISEEEPEVTTYRRQTGMLEDRVPAATCALWIEVSDHAILRVAATSGQFKDLAKYGCQDVTP